MQEGDGEIADPDSWNKTVEFLHTNWRKQNIRLLAQRVSLIDIEFSKDLFVIGCCSVDTDAITLDRETCTRFNLGASRSMDMDISFANEFGPNMIVVKSIPSHEKITFPRGYVLKPTIRQPIFTYTRPKQPISLNFHEIITTDELIRNLQHAYNLRNLSMFRCLLSGSTELPPLPSLEILELGLFTDQTLGILTVDFRNCPMVEQVRVDTRYRLILDQNDLIMDSSIKITYSTVNVINFVHASLFSLKTMHVQINWGDALAIKSILAPKDIHTIMLEVDPLETNPVNYVASPRDVNFSSRNLQLLARPGSMEENQKHKITYGTIYDEDQLTVLWEALLQKNPVCLVLGPGVSFILGLTRPKEFLFGVPRSIQSSILLKRYPTHKNPWTARSELLKGYGSYTQPVVLLTLTSFEHPPKNCLLLKELPENPKLVEPKTTTPFTSEVTVRMSSFITTSELPWPVFSKNLTYAIVSPECVKINTHKEFRKQ
jgi:hypothetical protein